MSPTMAAGFTGRLDTLYLLLFASVVWMSQATAFRPHPPRSLRPRADMFSFLSRQPANTHGQHDFVLHGTGIASDASAPPHIEQNELHRLRGLYNHLLEHPALMDSRLVASRPPGHEVEHDVNITDDNFDDDSSQLVNSRRIAKRKLELPLTESCPSVTEWISLNKSRDIHDNEVEIFQPNGSDEEAQLGAQFFYTTRCVSDVESEPCTGISFLYRSKCLTKKGYVMALVRKRPEESFDWNWIQECSTDISCGIAVKGYWLSTSSRVYRKGGTWYMVIDTY